MKHYHVKKPLFGIAAGRVERFADHKAHALLADGSIELYDEKKHGKLPGSPALLDETLRRRDAIEAEAATKALRGPANHKAMLEPAASK